MQTKEQLEKLDKKLLQTAKPCYFDSKSREAIRRDLKTVMRRIVIPQPKIKNGETGVFEPFDDGGFQMRIDGYRGIYDYAIYPEYAKGDILFVPEPWKCALMHKNGVWGMDVVYKDDAQTLPCLFQKFDKEPIKKRFEKFSKYERKGWQSPCIMPKEAARIYLKVTNVAVERLQNIITGDYKTPLNLNKDGLYEPCLRCTHFNGDCEDFIAEATCNLLDEWIIHWDESVIVDQYNWNANPYVWVYEFERLIKDGNRQTNMPV